MANDKNQTTWRVLGILIPVLLALISLAWHLMAGRVGAIESRLDRQETRWIKHMDDQKDRLDRIEQLIIWRNNGSSPSP